MTEPSTNLLWCDVESGGVDPLDPRRGYLLEVGFVVTTADLEVVTSASWLYPMSPEGITDARETAPAVIQEMHTANGLWGDLRAQDRFASTWHHIGGWVEQHAPTEPLAGSSVHQDKLWLDYWLPDTLTGRTHRLIDVSSLKELLHRWAPPIVASRPTPQAKHRVLPDIEDSIGELRHYRMALGLDHRECCEPATALSDDELPGMWSTSDFIGGVDVVRGSLVGPDGAV